MNAAEHSVLTPLHTVRQLLAFFHPPGELISGSWVSFTLQIHLHSALWVPVAGIAGLPCSSFSVMYVSFSFSVI